MSRHGRQGGRARPRRRLVVSIPLLWLVLKRRSWRQVHGVENLWTVYEKACFLSWWWRVVVVGSTGSRASTVVFPSRFEGLRKNFTFSTFSSCWKSVCLSTRPSYRCKGGGVVSSAAPPWIVAVVFISFHTVTWAQLSGRVSGN